VLAAEHAEVVRRIHQDRVHDILRTDQRDVVVSEVSFVTLKPCGAGRNHPASKGRLRMSPK